MKEPWKRVKKKMHFFGFFQIYIYIYIYIYIGESIEPSGKQLKWYMVKDGESIRCHDISTALQQMNGKEEKIYI